MGASGLCFTRGLGRGIRPLALVGLGLLLVTSAWAQPGEQAPLSPERIHQLVHMVRQDCGSCHGLTLKGGIGPALTAEALKNRSVEELRATILWGRPSTPMPPFHGIVSDAEATWIAGQLLSGFPHE